MNISMVHYPQPDLRLNAPNNILVESTQPHDFTKNTLQF